MKFARVAIAIGIVFLFIPSSLVYGNSFTCFNQPHDNTSNYKETTVLVTGFGPFDIYGVNPSQLIAETLNGKHINEAEVVGIVLPVDFEESVNATVQAIENYDPVLVISVGLSPKAHSIEVERIGINLKQMPCDEREWLFPHRVDSDGPFFRLSSIDTREVVLDLREMGIPAQQSFSTGMYIYNAVLYKTLGYIEDHDLSKKAGFIHVPLLISQDPNGMELETMIDAIEVSINSSLDEISIKHDICCEIYPYSKI